MRTTRRLAAVALTGLIAGFGWTAPAAADPVPDTVIIEGVDTFVPTDCARVGNRNSSVAAETYARWSNVSAGHLAIDQGTHVTPVAECVDKIFAAMDGYARALDARTPQLLRAALFTGQSNLTSPYQVFLDNIYITTTALASLTPSAPNADAGLGSCVVSPNLWLLDCDDDNGGRMLLRNNDGSPLRDWNGQMVYLDLSGGLSANGGTMYGNVFFRNLEATFPVEPLGGNVEKHEQVHAQQWSQHGFDFGGYYISEAIGDVGDRVWHGWTTGNWYPEPCFNTFERAAHFRWGNYNSCPASWL